VHPNWPSLTEAPKADWVSPPPQQILLAIRSTDFNSLLHRHHRAPFEEPSGKGTTPLSQARRSSVARCP